MEQTNKTNNYAKILNNYEDGLIEQFRDNNIFRNLWAFSNKGFEEMLIQRRYLSLHFTEFYDRAIDCLEDEEAKKVSRIIVREEYPLRLPSHREDLVTDLMTIGIPKERILKTQATQETKETIESLDRLVEFENNKNNNYDIKAVSALRIAGEILVAEEYRFLIPELEKRYGMNEKNSVFYWPHFKHDKKEQPIDANGASNGKTHSDSFSSILVRLIDSDKKLNVAMKSIENAYDVKAGWLDQFAKYLTIKGE